MPDIILRIESQEVPQVMNTTEIEQALTPLIGLPLRFLGRAANLLWIHFGEMREIATHRGGTKTVGEWAIHVQCRWRICRHGEILVARRDYYYTQEGDELDDWDSPGKSRFDQISGDLATEFDANPAAVFSVAIDDVGGFSLVLSHDYRLDVFPESTHDDASEQWRLFEPGGDREHFVVPSRYGESL